MFAIFLARKYPECSEILRKFSHREGTTPGLFREREGNVFPCQGDFNHCTVQAAWKAGIAHRFLFQCLIGTLQNLKASVVAHNSRTTLAVLLIYSSSMGGSQPFPCNTSCRDYRRSVIQLDRVGRFSPQHSGGER
jgi:hypothetical protein